MSGLHDRRRALRARLAGDGAVGTFLKLATPDVVDLVAAAGFDFAVVDLEHSTLSVAEALGLVRHADALGFPLQVRVPEVDGPLITRLLETGATGIQLSMLQTPAQARALVACTRFAPVGQRSVSMANRAAGFGARALPDFLSDENAAPPLLVGQIESAISDPWPDVLAGLDVAFVGTTDLAVSLGMPQPDRLSSAVREVADAAAAVGICFGGWASAAAQVAEQGLSGAGYLVLGSDVQILAAGLRAAGGER